jgi:hypothetical protein
MTAAAESLEDLPPENPEAADYAAFLAGRPEFYASVLKAALVEARTLRRRLMPDSEDTLELK